MNLALLSPNENAYSETFIQAHRKYLNGNIFFYNSGVLPSKLENTVLINSRRLRIIDIVKGHFNLNQFSLPETALLNSFKKNKIEVVLAEFGETASKILKLCKELNLPLIVHFHGYDASVTGVIHENNNYHDVFSTAKFVIVVSQKMYKDLLHLGCPEHKLIYNVYGPDDSFFKVRPRFSKQQFIAIGRFVDKKAPYYLILAFVRVLEKFPKALLVMAGNGVLLNTCKNLVKAYNIESKVKFVGIISPERYREFLEESLAFVQHSVTAENGDSEGTPVGILEASAAGLPVISTYHGGIPDIILNKKTGLLVDEHDVEGMAKNMIELLENVELAKHLGKAGRENIQFNFSMHRHIGLLNEVIEKAYYNDQF